MLTCQLTGYATAANVAYGVLQAAVKTDTGVVYFNDNLPAHLLFEDDGRLDGYAFVDMPCVRFFSLFDLVQHSCKVGRV